DRPRPVAPAECRRRRLPAGCRRWRFRESGTSPSAGPPGCPCPSLAVPATRGRQPRLNDALQLGGLLAGVADRLVVGASRRLLADIAVVCHLGEDVELAGPGRTRVVIEVVKRR